jgi:hypothetical protein
MRPSLQTIVTEIAESPMTYGILVAEGIRELEEAVNWMLSLDTSPKWRPLGGPFQAQHGSYCQAVTR